MNQISKYHTWIVILGLIVGLAIVCQPLASSLLDAAVCQVEKDGPEESEDGNPSETNISSFNAVTPAQQVITSVVDLFILDEITLDENRNNNTDVSFVEKLPGKFIRVLFNFIISPNAP